ncbi:MAG: ribbon-helix-helix domain-containing protein [Methyloligellaceae bacterium]
MCELFINADVTLWENQAKSIRINGMVTSIRLENFFWTVLNRIAKRDAMTVNQLIIKLYNESLHAGHNLDNFTSFLRVCCGRYLSLQLTGDIPCQSNVPIASLKAQKILEQESGYLLEDTMG